MKKYCLLLVLLLLPVTAFASTGGLQKKTIKTCPDGVVYGQHLSDGVLHWHRAVVADNSYSGWNADGDPLPGDPCPSSTTNKQVATTAATTTTRQATTAAATTTTTTTTTAEPTTTTETTTTTTETTAVTSETIKENSDEDEELDTAVGLGTLAILGGGTALAVYKGVTKKR